MNNEKNRFINLKRKFRNWCDKTTVHAVPNIVNNEQIMLKLMWTICLIASICYCGRIFTASIIDYFEFRVLTKFEIVQESFSIFPGIKRFNLSSLIMSINLFFLAITFCNLNKYDLNKNKIFKELYMPNISLNDTVIFRFFKKLNFVFIYLIFY